MNKTYKHYIEETHRAISTVWIRFRLFALLILFTIALIIAKDYFDKPLVETPFYKMAQQSFADYDNTHRAPYLDSKILTLQQKGGLIPILESAGIPHDTITNDLIPLISQYIEVSSLPAGEEISVTMRRGGNLLQPVLQSISIAKDKTHDVSIRRDMDNKLSVNLTPRTLYTEYITASYGVNQRIQSASLRSHMPSIILSNFMKTMAFSPLFKEAAKKNFDNRVTVLYNVDKDRNGLIARYGQIMMMNFQINGRDLSFYRFLDHEGRVGYYDTKGHIIPELFFHRPVNGGWISSPFGWRMHPILHRRIFHEGVDLAVPIGTPVHAAASGVVEMARRYGGFGKYIRIRNTKTYETEYAHLSRFAPGIHEGVRVKMGQLIAYSGTTGRSTGPHLHFGLIKAGTRINPLSKILIQKTLNGKDLQIFENIVKMYNHKLRKVVPPPTHFDVASNQDTKKSIE